MSDAKYSCQVYNNQRQTLLNVYHGLEKLEKADGRINVASSTFQVTRF